MLLNLSFNAMILSQTVFVDDALSSSKELENLAENFREQAAKLVDMLDISIPVVSKLKVITFVSNKSFLILLTSQNKQHWLTFSIEQN